MRASCIERRQGHRTAATCTAWGSRKPGRAAALHNQRRPAISRGFTLVELIAVMMLAGVLALVALPRMDGALSLRGAAWRDQVLAAMRHAHQLAQGHRRLVCASVASGAISLSIADTNPATACNQALASPDGHASFAHDSSAIATALSPSGTLYFQPTGRITSDGAGAIAVSATLSIAGESSINLVGETGHVE